MSRCTYVCVYADLQSVCNGKIFFDTNFFQTTAHIINAKYEHSTAQHSISTTNQF